MGTPSVSICPLGKKDRRVCLSKGTFPQSLPTRPSAPTFLSFLLDRFPVPEIGRDLTTTLWCTYR
jgi:hypothetical protein